MVEWRRRRPKAMICRRLAHVLYQLWTESPQICLDSAADNCGVTTDVQQQRIFQAYRYSPWDQPSKPQCTFGCHQHIGDDACQMSQSHMTEGPRIDWSSEVRELIPARHCSRMGSTQTRCRLGIQTSTWRQNMTRTTWALDLSLQTCAGDGWSWFRDQCNRMQADWSRAARVVDWWVSNLA